MVPFAQPGGGVLNGLNTYGSLRLEIDGKRLTALFIDDTGAVRDRFAIDKGAALVPRQRHDRVFLRGSHNDWRADPSDEMTLISNYTWEMERTLAAGDEFKFDLVGDWSDNYGDSDRDGVGDSFGANIAVPEGAGTYRIRFHTISKRFTVTKR